MKRKPLQSLPSLSLSMWKWSTLIALCAAWLFAPGCGPKEKVTAGNPCLFNSECADELRCISGACGIGKDEGAACTKDTECGGNLKCYNQVCAFGEQRKCVETPQCGAGKKCFETTTPGVKYCAFQNGEGFPCGADDDCKVGGESGLKCSGGYCLKPVGKGSPCPDTESCLAPQVCSSKGTCVEEGQPGTGKVDTACQSKEDCQKGLTCDANKKQCAAGGSKGQACEGQTDCAKGLACDAEGKCAEKGDPGTGAGGDGCQAAKECQRGLICGSQGTCAPRGAAKDGEPCAGSENCAAGLACARDPKAKEGELGKCTKEGEPGTTLGGEKCDEPTDCAFPLACGFSGTCVAVRPFAGTTCAANKDIEGPFRTFYEVPRKGTTPTEFYRLPFPNNIRQSANGKISLNGHANPGPLLGEDLIGKYIKGIENEVTGFSTNPVVYFRFSKALDFKTLALNGDKQALIYINLTTKKALGRRVRYSGGRSSYICQNYLTIRPFDDVPLAHGETYAVILTNVLSSTDGDKVTRDKDFDAIMGSSAPTDPDLKAAYDKYKDLRDYLKENGTNGKWPAPGDVVAATVFTTQDPDKQVAAFRDVIDQRPEPKYSQLTLCKDASTKSPCAGEGVVNSRECGKPDAKFHELHALVTMPVFLQGKAPYKSEGGDIKYSGGKPVFVENIDVCMAITIPKGVKPPADGWPVAIYGHGTGGNFRSHVVDGTAGKLSSIDTKNDKDEAVTVHYATIGIDQHLHGSRRGGDTTHPQYLFFNFSNPQASLNNQIQAAVDQFTLIKLIQVFKQPSSGSPLPEDITFDKTKIVYVGHSQGGVVAPLFLPFTPDVKAVVFSGAGGNLIQSLLNKTKPIDIASGIKAMLGEPGNLGSDHPLLSLLQMYFDRSDGANYGHLIAKAPLTDIPPKHTLQIYGIDDSFTPPATMAILAQTLGVQQVGPTDVTVPGISKNPIDPPARGNLTVRTAKVTATFGQYRPADTYDGHFVLFRNEDASRHFTQFLGTFLADKENIPTHVK